MKNKIALAVFSLFFLLPLTAMAGEEPVEAELARAFGPVTPSKWVVEFDDFITETGIVTIRDAKAEDVIDSDTVSLEGSEYNNSL